MKKNKIAERFKPLLQELIKKNLLNIKTIVSIAEELKYTNEQFFLDWEDELNKISIKDHNDLDTKKR